jgi:hypothetical protein
VFNDDGPEKEETLTVPASGSGWLSNWIPRNQTVTVTLRSKDDTTTDCHTATTEWVVDGPLYAHLYSDGVSFDENKEISKLPEYQNDGTADISIKVGRGHDGPDREVKVRLTRDGNTVFEVTRQFPAFTRIVFHDRVEATGSVTATVETDTAERTEEISLRKAQSLDIQAKKGKPVGREITFQMYYPGTETPPENPGPPEQR